MNGKRGFWLTSLIIGASIIVWLSLLGMVITGSIIAYYIGSDHNNSSPNNSCIYYDNC